MDWRGATGHCERNADAPTIYLGCNCCELLIRFASLRDVGRKVGRIVANAEEDSGFAVVQPRHAEEIKPVILGHTARLHGIGRPRL